MFGIPTPYVLGAALLAGFIGGYKVKDWQCDAAYAKVLEKAEKQRTQMQGIIDAKSTEYEQATAQAADNSVTKTNTIREIYKTTPAPSVNCSPPDPVIRLLNESIGYSSDATPTSKPSQ